MPITRTPIHDDDLSGETGTILDNAWKQEFYGQIDALAAAPILSRQHGSYASPATAALVTVAMPPLMLDDAVKVLVSVTQAAAAGGGLILAVIGGSVLIRFDDIGTNRVMNAGEYGLWEITIREAQVNSSYLSINAVGGVGGQPGGVRTFFGPVTGDWNVGGWGLSMFSESQAVGGTQYWSWIVSKL